MRLRQVLLTRFNWHQEFPGKPDVALSERWLSEREVLFREICYASVVAQTVTDFDWIVLAHPATPQPLLSRLASLRAPCRYQVWSKSRLSDLRKQLTRDTDVVLTTRLDSDDALHRAALSEVRRFYLSRPMDWVIANFENGLQLNLETRQISSRRFVSPPFSTMMHVLPGDPLGMGGDHSELPVRHQYVVIETGFPMFVQVIHPSNQMNRLHPGLVLGELGGVGVLRTEFGVDLARWTASRVVQRRA